jgi:hypothetical protein
MSERAGWVKGRVAWKRELAPHMTMSVAFRPAPQPGEANGYYFIALGVRSTRMFPSPAEAMGAAEDAARTHLRAALNALHEHA